MKMKKMGTMNLILVIDGISIVTFTAIMIYLYWLTGAIPDTLCTCFYSVTGGEFGVMGWIKTTKERNQDRQWQKEDKINNEKDGKI